MGEALLMACLFLFVMASVGVALLVFRWTAEQRLKDLELPPERQRKGLAGGLEKSMYMIGEIASGKAERADTLRARLMAAGFRSAHAPRVFLGIKVASAIGLGLVLGWVALLEQESLTASLMVMLCGTGFGYLVPERVLAGRLKRRGEAIERALPNALDLLVLGVEAGQSLDAAIFETSRELRRIYPELAAELAQVQVETRAGRPRAEVLYALGRRTGSSEVKKLAAVLADTDRFGTSLGPALRTHARYLRTRRKQDAQASARKLSVKLIFPVFFLIMPAIFVITLGPAVLTFYEAIGPTLGL
jgi:tight adherence protein C